MVLLLLEVGAAEGNIGEHLLSMLFVILSKLASVRRKPPPCMPKDGPSLGKKQLKCSADYGRGSEITMHNPRARIKELGHWLNPRTRHCGVAKGSIGRPSSEKTLRKGVVPRIGSGCS